MSLIVLTLSKDHIRFTIEQFLLIAVNYLYVITFVLLFFGLLPDELIFVCRSGLGITGLLALGLRVRVV